MAKKKISFSQYKLVRGLSFNDFDKWIRKFYEYAYNAGLEDGRNSVTEYTVSPEFCTTAINNDDLLDLILSVKGIGEKRAREIMAKIEDFGIDTTLWE